MSFTMKMVSVILSAALCWSPAVTRAPSGVCLSLLMQPLSPNSIITLADCGVAAMPSPSITRSKGSLWLIIEAILSFSRGMAAITSGISVG